jgi:hypothetical protein
MEIHTPKDLLRMYYYIIQAHTTLRPGPKFRAILNKAGIQEIDPPTKSELDAYFREVAAKKSRTNVPKKNFLKESRSMPIAVMTGGNFFRRIYNMILRLNRDDIVVLSVIVSFLSAVFFNYLPRFHMLPRLGEGGVVNPDARFLHGGLNNLDAVTALLFGGLLMFGADIRSRQLAITNSEIDLANIPNSGEFPMRASEEKEDPITFVPFETGNQIAIIGHDENARKNPVLVDSLQAWIAARRAGRQENIPHPAGLGTFVTQDNITIYTVRITQDGGRKKKSKSRKAKKSKTSTRKHFH